MSDYAETHGDDNIANPTPEQMRRAGCGCEDASAVAEQGSTRTVHVGDDEGGTRLPKAVIYLY